MRQEIEMSNTKKFLVNLAYDLKWKIKRLVYCSRHCIRILDIITNSGNDNQKYFLSIAITIKNEAKYMKEWLDYHLMIGVDHFYIYDNRSIDNLSEVLAPYITNGNVTYTKWNGKNQQLEIYKHAITNYKDETTWMALLDADEFLVSLTEQNIIDFLKCLNTNVAQVILGWMVFGSSGKKTYENDFVLERFKMHAKNSWIADSKPIIRPKYFLNISIPHWVDVFGKTVDENEKKLQRYPQINLVSSVPMPKLKFRINHYYSKSWEEFESKRNRGFADHEGLERTKNDFLEHDQNDISDDSIDSIIHKLKEIRARRSN
ncbi:glycosyltransferase family 2 protein [Leuconostoc gelidum subsp. gelidum]|uniref:glycosyltransferase family 92 protein n=1 Tax=Leuconostoc gelidum TaxID=1244 RepID=UPI001CC66216|nr:glycosyltransferase family 92 protein [Leuconostoc gelidum]MBZ5975037.1 glycosyltransferase family 2 protein [Leuconostoc gelidum subsp. gelidum]MBZ5978040.1 glycosyltransferase family 2 protein [Leuconostoc gelidum subsp. gelidum]